MSLCLSWNSLCRLWWIQTWRDSRTYLPLPPSSGIKEVYHHGWLVWGLVLFLFCFLLQHANCGQMSSKNVVLFPFQVFLTPDHLLSSKVTNLDSANSL